MKKGMMAFLGLFFALSFFAAAAVHDREFTLSPDAGNPGSRALSYFGWTRSEGNSSSGEGPVMRRPWIAALETFSLNIAVWAFDRYALNLDYSHISWTSWKDNLKSRWVWDSDTFGTSFFGHAYQGSHYFNSARSLGMNYWESIPYVVGGYVMWGYFMENDPPSKNDVIMTSLGGMSLGEVEYRLSSRLRDGAGGERTWREILAFAIDPVSSFNRWVFGNGTRVSPTNRESPAPFQGSLSFGGSMISKTGGLTGTKFSPGVSYDITYGAGSSEIDSRKPFDLFFLNGEVRYGQKKALISISTYGLLGGKVIGSSDRCKSVIGIFQNYDYFNSETIHLGSVSFSGGLVSLFPLGGDYELTTSLQAGFVPLGGVKNPYVLVGDRDYSYDWGGMGKAEVWLRHPRLGTVAVRCGRFQLYSINSAAPAEADEGHDFWTYVKADYALPLAQNLGLRVEYGFYDLHQKFNGHMPAVAKLSRVGAALDVRF